MNQDKITPEAMARVGTNAQLLLSLCIRAVQAMLGPNYKIALVLLHEGNPDRLAVLSDLNEEATLIAALRNGASKVEAGTMIDCHKAH